jgi:hypothetical protein
VGLYITTGLSGRELSSSSRVSDTRLLNEMALAPVPNLDDDKIVAAEGFQYDSCHGDHLPVKPSNLL